MARVWLGPALAMNLDDTLVLMVVAEDGQFYEISQVSPNGAWSGWTPIGAPKGSAVLYGEPALCTTNLIDAQALAVYHVDQESKLWTQARFAGGWDGWRPVSSPVGFVGTPALIPPSALRGDGARFVTGTDGVIYRSAPTPSGWAGFPLLAPLSSWDPGVAASLDGRLELFVGGPGGELYHTWEHSVGGSWAAWFSHGTPAPGVWMIGPPALGASLDGRLELLVVGTTTLGRGNLHGPLYHLWQTAVNDGWSDWYSHGTPPGTSLRPPAAVAPSLDGRLEVFAVGWDDGALWHIWQTAVNNGWSGWYSHGMPSPADFLIGPPVAAQSRDGRLHVFVVALNGSMHRISQTAVNNGWSGWVSHGMP